MSDEEADTKVQLKIIAGALKSLAEITVQLTNQVKNQQETITTLSQNIQNVKSHKRKGAPNESQDSSSEDDKSTEINFKNEGVFVSKKTIHKLLSQRRFVPLTELAQVGRHQDQKTTKLGNILISSNTTTKVESVVAAGRCILAFRAVFANMAIDNPKLVSGAHGIANYFNNLILSQNQGDVQTFKYAWKTIMQELTSVPYGSDKPIGYESGIPTDLRIRVEREIQELRFKEAERKAQGLGSGGAPPRNPKDEICLRFNRVLGCKAAECERKHVCLQCKTGTHNLQECRVASQADKDKVNEVRRRA